MIWLTLAGKWLAGFPRWVWYAIGIAVLAFGLIRYGHHKGYAKGHAETLAVIAAYDKAIAKQVASNKAKEEKDRLAFDAIADNLIKENEHAKANADRTIAELRSNKLRVRDNLKCPARTAEVAGSVSGGDDSGGAYVSRENQEFFLRIGTEADEVARRLTACQNIIKAERDIK